MSHLRGSDPHRDYRAVPRTMSDAFGPYAKLHVPRAKPRFSLLGAACCLVLAVFAVAVAYYLAKAHGA